MLPRDFGGFSKGGNLILKIMNSIEQLEWRYAVKKFDSNRLLSEDKIEKLKQAFNLTATSYGLQPIKMVVVQNKGLQEKLVPLSMEQQQVAQASHILILCIEKNVDADYIASYFDKVKRVRGTSDEILAPFKNGMVSSFSKKDVTQIQEWSKNQAYLAMGNLLTICAMEKIDSCPMEGFSPEGYDALLNLEEQGLKSVLVMPVGYRAEDDVFSTSDNVFNFKKVHNKYIVNNFEGQIDTGKMAFELLSKVQKLGVKVLNNISVESFTEIDNKVNVKTNRLDFYTKKLCIATNGFASQLLEENVKPARAQVLITKPIKNLHIKGTFHLDKGYYYFRNIDNRILFGGGRNLDFKTEETPEFGRTEIIQNKLEEILKTTILQNTNFEIEYSWSGIMGVGNQKKAIVKQVSNNVYCGVRLGGMGVAIGSLIGNELACLVD